MVFFYRLLPILTALAVGFVFYFQLSNPLIFPWPALLGVAITIISMLAIARRRVRFTDLMEKVLPTILFQLALIFGMLLAEGQFARGLIIFFGSLATFLCLELLFLLSFMPSRYPVNGLSHINIALVPFIVWYVIANSVGLMAFLHSPPWIHVALLTALSIVLFRTTGHPGATRDQNRLWVLIGGLTGLHIGLLGIALPLSMAAQGAIGMIIFCVVLRMRRYLYHPFPGLRQAWVEASSAMIVLGVALGTSRWL